MGLVHQSQKTQSRKTTSKLDAEGNGHEPCEIIINKFVTDRYQVRTFSAESTEVKTASKNPLKIGTC
jgi:hypothetical protein